MKQLKGYLGYLMFVAFCLTFLGVAPENAVAGTSVTGYGDTRAEAAQNAEDKARQLAKQKKTCYEYVDESKCKKSSEGGGWMCEADVANHNGSCGGDDKVRP